MKGNERRNGRPELQHWQGEKDVLSKRTVIRRRGYLLCSKPDSALGNMQSVSVISHIVDFGICEYACRVAIYRPDYNIYAPCNFVLCLGASKFGASNSSEIRTALPERECAEFESNLQMEGRVKIMVYRSASSKCRSKDHKERIPFWDLRMLDRHRSRSRRTCSRARAHTHTHPPSSAERLLRDERINSKAGREKEKSVLTLPVTVRRLLVSVNRSGGNFTLYSHGHLPFTLLSSRIYSTPLPVSPTTKDAARTAAATLPAVLLIYETSPLSGVHLDVRQFGAIDVYHYHEEHCFVPQLNVSGLSKRKLVGPVIAQEIPDENAP
ncbi:hypothetical protein ALC62_09556 [Cyphomyrmex costatus]|uniref:Uncharacterized protein n=1 Tax=Cyphomyrmex costatus TaxID=456900 RepID=A0A195CGT0_9HYME|nr:hypothetical protein ALC62_09556 [Cyphomyrmex costatus]